MMIPLLLAVVIALGLLASGVYEQEQEYRRKLARVNRNFDRMARTVEGWKR